MKLLTILVTTIITTTTYAGNTDGGGGRGVVCYDQNNNVTSVELLDLYEGKILEGLTPIESDESIEQILENVINKNINSQSVEFKEQLLYTKNIYKSFRYLPTGVRLKPIHDSGEIFVPASCKIEQVANMQGINKVFVVQDFWDKMNNVNKAALVMHEYLWATHRYAGRKLSKRARNLTAKYFAKNFTFTKVRPTSEYGKVVCETTNLDHRINKITVGTRFTVIPTSSGHRLEFGRLAGLPLHNNFYTEDSYLTDIFEDLEKEIYTQEEYEDYDSSEFTFDVLQENMGMQYLITAETKFTKLSENEYKKEIKFRAIDMEFPDVVINESALSCYKEDYYGENTEDVTLNFLRDFTGIYKENSFNETIEITENQTLILRYARQVGRERSSRVPYPTVCGYKVISEITSIEKRVDIQNTPDKRTTHYLNYITNRYELDDTINPGSTSNKYCQNFINEENSVISTEEYRHDLIVNQNQITLDSNTYIKE